MLTWSWWYDAWYPTQFKCYMAPKEVYLFILLFKYFSIWGGNLTWWIVVVFSKRKTRSVIISMACKCGNVECRDDALSLFADFMASYNVSDPSIDRFVSSLHQSFQIEGAKKIMAHIKTAKRPKNPTHLPTGVQGPYANPGSPKVLNAFLC